MIDSMCKFPHMHALLTTRNREWVVISGMGRIMEDCIRVSIDGGPKIHKYGRLKMASCMRLIQGPAAFRSDGPGNPPLVPIDHVVVPVLVCQ